MIDSLSLRHFTLGSDRFVLCTAHCTSCARGLSDLPLVACCCTLRQLRSPLAKLSNALRTTFLPVGYPASVAGALAVEAIDARVPFHVSRTMGKSRIH
eukprot:SAG11_NODE_192_length_12931_cov_5.747682_2_plen_98_part_00